MRERRQPAGGPWPSHSETVASLYYLPKHTCFAFFHPNSTWTSLELSPDNRCAESIKAGSMRPELNSCSRNVRSWSWEWRMGTWENPSSTITIVFIHSFKQTSESSVSIEGLLRDRHWWSLQQWCSEKLRNMGSFCRQKLGGTGKLIAKDKKGLFAARLPPLWESGKSYQQTAWLPLRRWRGPRWQIASLVLAKKSQTDLLISHSREGWSCT